ncbi:MAG: CDP-paratose 2-epimerase [Euryarchaeota archaeon]|jgi:CDP-paratose 2-epimerase|nr:CDP-paratose 2-epimerase [Euryarchaeota archaeon]|tara:strand:+ start:51450 stop:52463 length:1014 start_codon:yes stop_codon:yes gene_type:complete
MKILITGGAGFIGCNSADYFLGKDHEVSVLDNLSRAGTDKNLEWLQKRHPNVIFVKADVRTDQSVLNEEVSKADAVIHLAAQVAVTTSVTNPREDFDINALGTFNVLEAIRKSENKPPLIYSSTNKVYGKMEELEVVEGENRYKYKDIEGVDENQNLDFHSPYGCSKGAADQYVLDYARIYNLKTVVLRQSCIYGTRQFGIEDQGWVAWFIIATSLGTPLKIYGNGKQVRDVLYIDDLVRCFEMAFDNINKTTGKAYNIGGGPNNSLSLLELIAQLENLHGNEIEHSFHDWRPGDQPVFICDISKAKNDFGWEPKVSPEEGVKKLFNWVQENKELFQ